jgi:hypothetical protein
LKSVGWGVVEGSRIRREYPIAPGRIEGHGKRGKPLTADYVLEYRNTKLGVVETKALDEELPEGVGHVAYALPPVSREGRAEHARVHINSQFNAKQQAFLDFVLSHYVSVGVEELNQDKLKPLLLIKYHNSIQDAVADLGKPEEIGKVFAGFQKYLYTAPKSSTL